MKTKMIFKYLNLLLLMLLFFSFSLKAETTYDNRTEEILLPTIQCGMCKKTIEKAVNKVEGVISISVDVNEKKAIVVFDDTKTTLAAIESVISKSGYNANNKIANKEAYDKLDDCCKVPE
ncbi:MAG: cation transporter [Ignavibacteria bacterium]|nr:cation transporter [Ignavibacteria bacterium]